MNLNEASVRKDLGFDLILEILGGTLLTDEGRSFLEDCQPYFNTRELDDELGRTREMATVLADGNEPDWEYTVSPLPLLAEARIGGNWLKASEFLGLLKWIRTSTNLYSFFRTNKEECPGLWEIIEPHEPLKLLHKNIEAVIEPTGEVRDNASDKLLNLRREVRRNASDLRKKLNKILRSARTNGWTKHEEITIRNDRLVIPLNADFKGRIPGFVQDVSQSGGTIFLEPTESLELNNAQKRLVAEERNEVIRILMNLTQKVGQEDSAIRDWAALMGQVDLIRSKG